MTSVQNCFTAPAMTGPRHSTGSVSLSRRRLMDITWMPDWVSAGYRPDWSAPWHSDTPKALGMEGPVISASRMPTRWPFRAMATANWAVTVLFPTPPFPETTAITFFTWDLGFSCAKRLSALRSPQSEPQEAQLPLQDSLINFSPYAGKPALFCALLYSPKLSLSTG